MSAGDRLLTPSKRSQETDLRARSCASASASVEGVERDAPAAWPEAAALGLATLGATNWGA
eukprot:4770591-Alexandrium_andersonii.AAC.1